MTTKEYRLSVALKAEVIVEVNGKAVTLQFNNGSFMGGVRRGGYCTVTDPEVQQALESSENFGPMYFCAKTTVVEDAKPKYVAPVKKETKAPAEPTADPFALVEPIKTTILPEIDESQAIDDHGIIVGITNSQKAKQVLLKRFPGTTNAMLPNTAAILAFAQKHEITFPDWDAK